MKDLKEKTLRAGLAKVIAQGVNFVLRAGSMMVLARLLDPKDFGLVGMVTVVTGFVSLIRDAGLGIVTIQRATINDEQVSTLFWINILLGAILALLLLAAAPLLVSFYQEPRLFWVATVLGFGFLFHACGVQHSALLERQMSFTALSAIDVISLIVSIVVGISMAIVGYGYWALVFMTIVTPAVYTVCVWLTTRWVPGRLRRGVGVGSMMRFGGMTTLNTLVTYLAFNLEKILLGRVWGAEALGVYGRAYQLINIPTENLNSAIGGVAFSALSRLQDDTNRLKRYFLSGYSLVISVTLPITITCAFFADDIILLLLGPKWNDAVPIFRLLTPTILTFALVNPFWSFLMSQGMVGRITKTVFVLAPVMIASYVIGLPYGPIGVAFAYSAAMTLSVIPLIASCVYGTIISVKDFLPVVGRPLLSALVGGGCAYAVHALYGPSLSPLLRLTLGGGVLLLSYVWMLLYVMGQKAFYVDLLRGVWQGSPISQKASAAV